MQSFTNYWLVKERSAQSVRGMATWMLLAVACAFVAMISRMTEITHDVYHEMALFREFLVSGEFPRHDVFAFTPTRNPAVHHEWGMGAILYFVTMQCGLGLAGLSALRWALIAALWCVTYRVARLRGAHPYIFACFALLTFPFLWVGFSLLRAQLVTLVFLAIQLWMHEVDRRGERWWVIGWWLMMVAWLNIHAGFLVGIGCFGLHAAERFAAHWWTSRSLTLSLKKCSHLIVGAAAIPLALPLNPYGWQYLPYLLEAVSMPRPLIAEWHPLWYAYSPVVTILAYAASVAIVLVAVRSLSLTRMSGFAFLTVCAFESLKHIRHGSIYSVAWLAYVPAWLSQCEFGRCFVKAIDGHRTGAVRVSQFCIVVCLAFSSWHQFWKPTLPANTAQSMAAQPVQAVEYLKRNRFSGNLMTQFNQGAYVSWCMHPSVKVSLDGRYEVAYPHEVVEAFHTFATGRDGWQAVMDRYGAAAVMVSQHAEVRPKLEIFRGDCAASFAATKKSTKAQTASLTPWRFVYEDDGFVILASPSCDLPYENHLGTNLVDGAGSLFTFEHSHRSRW